MVTLPGLLRNSTLLALGTAASKGLVLCSYLILTRLLGPEDFGRYSLVFAYLAFFELVADAGLDTIAVREVSRHGIQEETRRGVGDALVLRCLLILLVVPAAALLFPWITGNPLPIALVGLAGLAMIPSNRRASLRSLFEVPFRASLEMGWPTFLGVVTEVVHLAALTWLVTSWGLGGAIGAQTLAALPFLLLLALLSVRRLPPILRPTRERLRALAVASSPLLGILFLSVVLSRVDVLMLERMRGTHAVGLYAAPVRIAEAVNFLPILLMTSVYPLFARFVSDVPMVDRLFRASLRVLTTMVLPIVALEIAFAEPIVTRLLGDAYTESARIFPWLAVSALLVFADIVTGARLVATGLETRNLHLVLFAAVTNVGANFWLIPRYGAVGAAAGTLIAYAVRLVAGFLFSDTRALTVLTIQSIAPATFAGLVCFGPALLVSEFRLAAFTCGIVAYPVALYLLGAVRVPEVARLIAAIRPAAQRRPPGRTRRVEDIEEE